MAPHGGSSSDEDKPFECVCCFEDTRKCTGESCCHIGVALAAAAAASHEELRLSYSPMLLPMPARQIYY